MATNSTVSTGNSKTGQVADAAQRAVERGTESAARAAARVKRSAAASERQLAQKSDEARRLTKQAAGSVRRFSRDNPVAVAGFVIAAGLLLSHLLRR